MSTISRYVASVAALVVLATAGVRSEDLGSYRGFALGSSVQAVSTLVKFDPAQVQTNHRRPALLQTIEWRPPYVTSGNGAGKDPARQIEFSFYDDQLYRIAVDYDTERTRGMTASDIVDALVAVYGAVAPAMPRNAINNADIDLDAGRIVGRWGTLDQRIVAYQKVDLYGGIDGSRFTLTITSLRLAALSKTATAQALRLDEREAPQREIARQKKEADDERELQQKSRATNKAIFTP